MGGTLARYSAEGVRTIVVTCTLGELAMIFEPSLVGQDVATVRGQELQAATRALGVSRTVQLGYLDSGMAGVPENRRPGAFFMADLNEAASKVQALIEEERPQVVVTYDETGGYGHPDHVKAHQVAVAAFCGCSDAARPERLYFIRFPLSWSREFVRSLREAGIDAPGSAASGADAGSGVVDIGVSDELVTTAVDVRRYVHQKQRAVASHRSQWPTDHFVRRIPPDLAQRLWAYEYFSREPSAVPTGQLSLGERLARDQLETDLFTGLE